MNVWIYAAAGAVLAAAAVYFFRYRAPRALVTLVFEKTGRAPAHSRLKREWTSLPALERTLQILKKRGFTTMLPQELQKKQAEKSVLLAFMGGYQTFFTEVFPLLQKYNAKACVFLAQEYIGTYNAWQDPHAEPWQNLLTEKQLKTLAKSGLVAFGALDLQARDLTALPAEEARFGAEENVFRLKTQLGVDTQIFAFWPAKKWDEKTASEITGRLNNLPTLTPSAGVSAPSHKTVFLKTLRGNSPRARFALWVRR